MSVNSYNKMLGVKISEIKKNTQAERDHPGIDRHNFLRIGALYGLIPTTFFNTYKEKIMKTLFNSVTAVALFCIFLLTAFPLYAADPGVKIGTLEVKAIQSTRHNLIIMSSVDVNAVFTDSSGNKEHYIGEMGYKLGIDFSHKTDETLSYLVVSATSDYKSGSYALQGKYFGTKASVAVGAGAGVQILLGGFEKSFTLQPVSVGGVEGYGASLGLGYLYLQKDHKK